MDLRNILFSNQDLKYREFTEKLIPGCSNIIGVRTPVLRDIAKKISKNNGIEFLESFVPEYHEEKLVYGFVISYVKTDISEKIRFLRKYIPYIDNWAVCDQISLKLKESEKEEYWNFICKYFDKPGEYEKRFAVVNLMKFIEDDYIDSVLEKLENVQHEGYYLKMGVAWSVSMCFVKYPEKTTEFLKHSKLDDFTHNKSIQKITESFKVSDEMKKEIRKLKR